MAQPELIKDIEARVKDTGDIMTGNLKVPDLDIANDICRGSIYGETNSLNFRGGNPTTEKYTYLKIAEDGAYIDNQKIYYPGNKPTPASIGAAPAGYGSFGETLTDALVLDDEDGALLRNKLIEIAQSMEAPNTKRIFFHASPFVEAYWSFGIVSSFVNETGKLRVILDAYMTNGHVWKMMYAEGAATEWTEPEFQNPILLVGTEYRTTERYKNKAVYKKLDSDGVIKWRLDGETSWHTDKPISKSVTLSASAWNSTSKTQTVTVSGVLADETKQLITPTPALASQAAYYDSVILCTGQTVNQLTFTAKKIPTTDLTVYVTIQEVGA